MTAFDAETHRTIIWVVVDDARRVLVRTYRGARSRWYREALAAGRAALLVDGRSIDVAVELAADPDRMDAYDRAVQAKYAGDPAAAAMVADELRPTTLELRPG